MRIVHVTDTFLPKVGGIERQVESLARQQYADGHDVRIVTAVPVRRCGKSTEPAIDGVLDGIEVVHGTVWQYHTSFSFPRLRRLSRAAANGGEVDVLHAHMSVFSPVAVHAARAATRRNIATAFTVHSLWPARFPAIAPLYNVPFGSASVRATWSAVSSAAAELVARGLPGAEKVLVVPNIVNTEWWQRTDGSRGSGQPGLHVVTVGRLASRKRIVPLMHLLADVANRIPDRRYLKVSIVGDGPRRDEVEGLIKSLKLTEQVTLLGQREPAEIRALLHSADVFIAPARRESFGIAALEARAAGLPVLGLRGNGLADFITDGQDGMLVGSDHELANALVGLIAAPGRLFRLHEVTATEAPSIGAADAVRAAELLYAEAIARTRLAPRSRASTARPAGD